MVETKATTSQPVYCVNHPQTETLLRCNKCGKPVCLKCVERTVVGYRCRECLGQQRVGYYNASALDYILAGVVGMILSILGGVAMLFIGAFWFFAIFAGPIGGGIVAEGIRWAIRRRRGRYIWLVACATLIVGGLIGVGNILWLTLPLMLLEGRSSLIGPLVSGLVSHLGFWIYLALAVSTAYARLRV